MAELERRFPERAKLRAADPRGLAEAWAMIEGIWKTTLTRARAITEPFLYERIDDEWSFVETLRHLLMASDCWLRRMVKGMETPYHPWGLAGSWLRDPASLGIDPGAAPSVDDVVKARRERMGEVRQTIAALTPGGAGACVRPSRHPGPPDERTHGWRMSARDPV
jgi:DinB superfamily